jgi:DNA repair protein RadA/Sms
MMGNPRRVAVGLEQNRLAILLAVLHRHGGLQNAPVATTKAPGA